MNQKSVEDFVVALTEDADMGTALNEAIAGAEGSRVYERVSEFARDRGYELSADKARAVHETILRQAQANDGELDPEQLEAVAGGLDLGLNTVASGVHDAYSDLTDGGSPFNQCLNKFSDQNLKKTFTSW